MATLTADKDGVLEAALKHGRRVEAFLVDADARSKVNKRLADTFQDSWRMRTIPVSAYAVARRPLSANNYNFHATLNRKYWVVSIVPLVSPCCGTFFCDYFTVGISVLWYVFLCLFYRRCLHAEARVPSNGFREHEFLPYQSLPRVRVASQSFSQFVFACPFSCFSSTSRRQGRSAR